MSTSPTNQQQKSPKSSKIGTLGRKLVDSLKQMEIAADSWSAPAEWNQGQGAWVRDRAPPGMMGGGPAHLHRSGPANHLSREAMMFEVERGRRLQELKRLHEQEELMQARRQHMASMSPSERTMDFGSPGGGRPPSGPGLGTSGPGPGRDPSESMSYKTGPSYDDEVQRLTQALSDLENRKGYLQEQQAETEDKLRQQSENHDRQLQERMHALNQSPNMAPPDVPTSPAASGPAVPAEDTFNSPYYARSPSHQPSANRTPSSHQNSAGMPSTPASKSDELYSRMNNDELRNLAAIGNIPSFDRVPLATPVMKPQDPHWDHRQRQQQQGPQRDMPRYPYGNPYDEPGYRDSNADRPPWEKWQARRPEFESMDDIRARSAPLYRQDEGYWGGGPSGGAGGGPPWSQEPRRGRPRANSEASQNHDPFGVGFDGPGGPAYGSSSIYDSNPFDDGGPRTGDSNLDSIDPDDIFGTGHTSLDDQDWPPPPHQQQQPFPPYGPDGPWDQPRARGGPPNDWTGGMYGGTMPPSRSRSTSESSVPFGDSGETFPRAGHPHQHQRQPNGPRNGHQSMSHGHRGGGTEQGFGPPMGRNAPRGRRRSTSGPPRPNYPGFPNGGEQTPYGWQQFADYGRPNYQHPSHQQQGRGFGSRGMGHRISRDDIETARAQAGVIRREREKEAQFRTVRQQQHPNPQDFGPAPGSYGHQQGAPPSQPQPTGGLSDQDLSYLSSDPIVRDLVLQKLSPMERRTVMEKLHQRGPVTLNDEDFQQAPIGSGQNSGPWPSARKQRHEQRPRRPQDQHLPQSSAGGPVDQPSGRIRFADDTPGGNSTPIASPRLPPQANASQSEAAFSGLPQHYPGRPPNFPSSAPTQVPNEFRVHRKGARLDGFENCQVIQHIASYPPSTDRSLDPNEAVANQILDLVTQAKDFGGAVLLNLQTRELPSGHYIVEGDAAR